MPSAPSSSRSALLPLTAHRLPGRLVAVCGTDGTGKSTAVSRLAASLTARGVSRSNVLELRQPSEWWRSDPHMKATILKEGDAALVDELALGVFAVADRLNQQVQIIEPALASGKTVLMDRYVYCMMAYYLGTGEPETDYLATVCEPLFQPDVTFILDLPPEAAIDRVVRRDGRHADRYDQQLGLTTAIVGAYRALASENELHLFSALETPDAIAEKMLAALDEHGDGTGT